MNTRESDKPYGNLPEGSTTSFPKSRIEGVAAEIRYSDGPETDLSKFAVQMLDMFSLHGVTQIEPALQNQIAINIGDRGQADSKILTTDQGWQMTNPEKSIAFTVLTSVAFVQIREYERWSQSLAPKLETLLSAVEQFVSPQIVQRIGLRYINRLLGEENLSSTQWVGRVRPQFLGPIGDPVFGGLVSDVQIQSRISLEPSVSALLRNGPVQDPAGTNGGYMVDIDVFVDKSQEFDSERVLHQAQRLNRTAFALFKRVITDSEISNLANTEGLSMRNGRVEEDGEHEPA